MEVGSTFFQVVVTIELESLLLYKADFLLNSGSKLSPIDLKYPLFVVNFSPVHLQWYLLCIILGRIGKIVIFCSVVQMRNPYWERLLRGKLHSPIVGIMQIVTCLVFRAMKKTNACMIFIQILAWEPLQIDCYLMILRYLFISWFNFLKRCL